MLAAPALLLLPLLASVPRMAAQPSCDMARGHLTSITGATSASDCTSASASDCTSAPSNPVTRYEYAYDERGNRTAERYFEGAKPVEETAYRYDGADRLTGVRYPGDKVVLYGLGGDGTRLTETRYVGTDWTAPVGAQLLQYRYDGSGAPSRLEDVSSGQAPVVVASWGVAPGTAHSHSQLAPHRARPWQPPMSARDARGPAPRANSMERSWGGGHGSNSRD